MIDVSNAKWELSKEEAFAIEWFEEHGYTGKIIRQYISKTIFEISKNGTTDEFELPQGIVFKNMHGYMEQFRKKLGCALRTRTFETRNKRLISSEGEIICCQYNLFILKTENENLV